MKKKKKLLVAILAVILCFSSASYAGWQDDWLSSKSVSGPSYFEGSKRGYFSGGSLSARWPVSNDNVMTITPPSLNIGCGGIDAFLGGFSFMNLNYLVQKLQRILSAAPAAAFDIALKTLAPQVSETIKALEAITDRLNGLQLDDCKASKALVATVASPLSDIVGDRLRSQVTTAQGDFIVSTGGDDLYENFKTNVKNVYTASMGSAPPPGNVVQQSAQQATAGCPALYQAIFNSGSLLDNLAALKGISSSHVALIRGFIGDVEIKSPAQTNSVYQAQFVPPCDKNQNIENFFVGDVELRPSSTGACTASTDTNRNLLNYASVMMSSIAVKLKTGGTYLPDEIAFLNTVPASVLTVLRTAIAANSETQVIGQLSEVVAKLYAYSMLTDMFGRTSQMIALANHISSSSQGSAAGMDEMSCKKEMFADVETKLLALDEHIYARLTDIRASIANSTEQLNAMQNLFDKWRKFDQLTRSTLNQQFGPVNTDRVLGG